MERVDHYLRFDHFKSFLKARNAQNSQAKITEPIVLSITKMYYMVFMITRSASCCTVIVLL
jgi:hypothetical protein